MCVLTTQDPSGKIDVWNGWNYPNVRASLTSGGWHGPWRDAYEMPMGGSGTSSAKETGMCWDRCLRQYCCEWLPNIISPLHTSTCRYTHLVTEEAERSVVSIKGGGGWQRVKVGAHPGGTWSAGLSPQEHHLSSHTPFKEMCSRRWRRIWFFSHSL